MKPLSLKQFISVLITTFLLIGSRSAFGQTNLDFTATSSTVEGAKLLSWNSLTNEIYQIDFTDSLGDAITTNITWTTLYEDYPSHGTNTFWLDTGNYLTDPIILHPSKVPFRVYRVKLVGTNSIPGPSVAITSVTNGYSATGDLSVTVSTSTDQPFTSTKLYVDGQEMQEADTQTNYTASGTNYVDATYILNSTEWANGPHTLFATARAESGAAGSHDVSSVSLGYSVSPYVQVTFSNLITRISFSEHSFMPEDGQTQHVSAVFAANVDWTLDIQDVDATTVLTVSGSGTSMAFDWDGTGTGGTNLPVGAYTYYFTASTNGSSSFSMMSSLPSFSLSAEPTALWAASDTSDGLAPLSIFPPSFNFDALTVFEATRSEVSAMRETSLSTALAAFDSHSLGGSGVMSLSSAPNSQNSRTPKRPPINPVKGRAGVYGIAYQTYSGNGAGYSVQSLDNGLHLNQRVALEGHSGASSTFVWPDVTPLKTEANNFIAQMKKSNWSQGFAKANDSLKITDLRSSGSNIFNQVKLGVLMLHGTYGTGQDFTASGCKQMYFVISSGHTAQYLRMSEMSLGSSATNGLKWMAINACNSLYQANWQSMQNASVKPNNSNLHLLLGTDSTIFVNDNMMKYWAKYMTRTNAMTIKDAWVQSGKDAFTNGYNYNVTMRLAVAGDTACQSDKLSSTTTPSGSAFYSSTQVFPLP